MMNWFSTSFFYYLFIFYVLCKITFEQRHILVYNAKENCYHGTGKRSFNMKKYNVGIIGATGMVGQRFSLLLDKHPWFNVVCVAASPRSAGKKLKDAVAGKWKLSEPLPEAIGELTVLNAEEDVEKIASMVDFVFCAVDMKKDEIRALEEKYAKAECPVVSNNSAHRHTPDVPMVIPEVNPEHIEIIASQRKKTWYKERIYRS